MNIDLYFKGVEFQIEFDFQPEEPMVMYYKDGSGYPGCAAEVTIESIKHQGVDFYDVLEDSISDIEDMVLAKIADDRENY